MPLSLESQVVPPLMENSYLVWDEASREALLVDPGGVLDGLERVIADRRLRPVAAVATHGHIDHLAGAAWARRALGVPLWMHPGDRPVLSILPLQAAILGFPPVETPEVQRWLADGDSVELGEAKARVIHTPGHSEGGLCLYFEQEKLLFCGDTLFARSIGRTDLPGGNPAALTRSIRERLFPLGDDVRFYPGHGPGGTLGQERRGNPFVGESAGRLG